MTKWMTLVFTIWISISSFNGQKSFNSFYFKEPQPVDNKSSKKFPKKIQGSYYKLNDSIVQIVIAPDSIYTSFAIAMPISNKEIQKSSHFFKKDSLLGDLFFLFFKISLKQYLSCRNLKVIKL